MAGLDEARSEVGQTNVSPRQPRLFWTATTLAIAGMLLLCSVLVLIAATRS